MKPHGQEGLTLIELLIVLAIAGLLLGTVTPVFARYRRTRAVAVAADELRTTFRAVRQRAATRSTNCGVKFTRSGNEWSCSFYEDADGDGVRNDDIASGVDRRYAGPFTVAPSFQHLAAIGFPSPLPYALKDPDGDDVTTKSEPVSFNRSTICAFSPIGGGTPGSIYITDRVGTLYCVRVYGATGKVRLLRYEPVLRKWEER